MKVDKSIPWVRFLFTGYIEDTDGYISQYRFTTINYNPEGCNKKESCKDFGRAFYNSAARENKGVSFCESRCNLR